MSDCKCPIRKNMSWDQLMDEIVRPRKMCTDVLNTPGAGWMCSNLLNELKRSEVMRSYRERRKKELKHQGYSEEAAEKKAKSGRTRGTKEYTKVALDIDSL